jgi:hypothetical protein
VQKNPVHFLFVIGQKSNAGRLLGKGTKAQATYWGVSSQASTPLP